MSILLVTYDLKKPGQNYSGFHDIIKKNAWARLSESSYAVDTVDSPQTLYNKLAPHMDTTDQAYIITLKSPYFGQGPEEVNQWLSQRL